MAKPMERGPLTDYLLDQISDVVTVGDGQAPQAGGWSGPPDSADSEYTAYVVLVPGTAGDSTGPIGDSISDLQLPYIVTGYGLSRGHVEHYMDMVRKVLVATSRTMVVLGDSSWKIQQVRADSIGGISRNDSIEPSEFSQTDVVVLYMSKEL